MATERDPNYVTDKAVYFYTPRYYAFDNFSAFSIELWGRVFMTAEHAYQWKKYSESSLELAEEIANTKSAHAAKKLSDANKDKVGNAWQREKVAVMEEILRAKVAQHEKVHRLLLETGDKDIIENSPTDVFWGIGPDGVGENQLGRLWVKLREELKENT